MIIYAINLYNTDVVLENIDYHEINIIPGAIRKSFTKADLPQMIAFDNFAMLEKSDTPPDHAPPPLTLEEVNNALAREGM